MCEFWDTFTHAQVSLGICDELVPPMLKSLRKLVYIFIQPIHILPCTLKHLCLLYAIKCKYDAILCSVVLLHHLWDKVKGGKACGYSLQRRCSSLGIFHSQMLNLNLQISLTEGILKILTSFRIQKCSTLLRFPRITVSPAHVRCRNLTLCSLFLY